MRRLNYFFVFLIVQSFQSLELAQNISSAYKNLFIDQAQGLSQTLQQNVWDIYFKITSQNKNLLDPKQKNFYDIIISQSSINQLQSEGWYIYEQGTESPLQLLSTSLYARMSVLGNFNRGKSWVLEQLSGETEELISGFALRTKGIGIKIDRNKNFVYFDTEGFDTPVPVNKIWEQYQKELQQNNKLAGMSSQQQKQLRNHVIRQQAIEKQLNEKLIQKFIIENSQILLIVVDQLSQQDQKLINFVCKSYSGTKDIFIIHNLKNILTIKDVETCIQEHIKQNFNVREIIQNITEKQMIFFDREYQLKFFQDLDFAFDGAKAVQHLILANKDSEQGRIYNKLVFDKLKEIMSNVAKFKIDLVEKFVTSSNQFYKNYLNYAAIGDLTNQRIINAHKINNAEKVKQLGYYSSYKIKLTDRITGIEPRQSWIDEFGVLSLIDAIPQRLKKIKIQNSDYVLWEIYLPSFIKDFHELKKLKPDYSEDGSEVQLKILIKEPENKKKTGNQSEETPEYLANSYQDTSFPYTVTSLTIQANHNIYQWQKFEVENGVIKNFYLIVSPDCD